MLILEDDNYIVTIQFEYKGNQYQIKCLKDNLEDFVSVRKIEIDRHYENGGDYSDLLWKDYTTKK